MTELYVYDAAYRPDLSKVKRNGVAINGYLTGKYANTTTQPKEALAAGLGYIPTYEEGNSELVNASRASGQAVGRKILAAFAAKGLPLDGSLAVYPSVDVAEASATACDEAWRGLRDVLKGKVSLRYYGEGRIGDHLYDAGLLDGPYWLAAPTSWPGYAFSHRVCMVQLVGTNVPGTDQDHLITDPHALGALWPAGSPYGVELLDPKDPVVVALNAKIDRNQSQINGWFGLVVHGDKNHPNSQDAEAIHLAAVSAALDKLQVGGVDAAALAKAIVENLHVQLTTQ